MSNIRKAQCALEGCQWNLASALLQKHDIQACSGPRAQLSIAFSAGSCHEGVHEGGEHASSEIFCVILVHMLKCKYVREL